MDSDTVNEDLTDLLRYFEQVELFPWLFVEQTREQFPKRVYKHAIRDVVMSVQWGHVTHFDGSVGEIRYVRMYLYGTWYTESKRTEVIGGWSDEIDHALVCAARKLYAQFKRVDSNS